MNSSANNKATLQRTKMLIANYIDAKNSGLISGYDICLVEPDNYEHYYILVNPKTGVYKGHSYVLELKTTYGRDEDVQSYPINPPFVHFVTHVYHTNINPTGGTICVDILKDANAWVPTYSFDAIVKNILILFDEPNNASPWNQDASKVWVACENIYNSQKKALGPNTSIETLDLVYAKCFKPFIDKAVLDMNKNKINKYYEYFPQLNPNATKSDFLQNKQDFEELVTMYDLMKSKKKSLVAVEIIKKDNKDKDKDSEDSEDIKDKDKNKDNEPKVMEESKPKAPSRWAKYQTKSK
jgi:ubiquitin-protein ligase